jgi:protoporphyrinogen oxidase
MPEATRSPLRVVVLGGGLAGLSCAWRLAQGGATVTVLEKEDVVGGCARSFRWKDTIHDLGPHRWHSRNPKLIEHLEALMGDNLTTLDRLSRIFLYKKYFDYPLVTTNVVKNLPPWVLARAFLDYFAIRVRNRIKPIPDDNFENWTRKRFGNTLYKLFFGTYTEKAWGMSATQISADWASQRISLLSLMDAAKRTLFRPSEEEATAEEVTSFWYPKKGGIGEIAEAYRRAIETAGGRVLTGVQVERVVHQDGGACAVVYRQEGSSLNEEMDHLVSTIPCTDLVRLMDPPAPPEVIEANDALRYKAIKFVFLDVRRDSITHDHWVYIPQKELRTHRLSEAKNFNPRNAPPGRTVLACEVTCFKDDEVWHMGREEATAMVIEDLGVLGLVRPEEVLDSHVYNLEHAYPLYDLSYKPHVTAVLGYVDSFTNVTSTGRQGRYKYNNMDHSMEMGLSAGAAILAEETADHRKVASGSEYFG